MKDFMNAVGKYFWKILISIDQLGNVVFLNGSPDHTISGHVGYYSQLGRKWAIVLEYIINGIFFWDYNHCYNSIEWHVIERDGIYKDSHRIDKPTK